MEGRVGGRDGRVGDQKVFVLLGGVCDVEKVEADMM
jgi:hypothetical protein